MMSSEDKEAESKSKYTISNNSLLSNTMITTKQQNKPPNTSTDDDDNNNKKNECIATFEIQSTTFKKRKKRSKSKQMIKPSACSNNTNPKKRKLTDINNENETDSMIIKNSQINSKQKRRKLTNEFSTDKLTKNTNNNTPTIISYKSERNVLPFGLEGQGAAVQVFVEENNKNRKISNKPSVTSNGYIRYNGSSKPVRKAPKFLGIGPQRAPDNVKITCRFDYQPDICKDWKETGFCGYGQSCKFLHDRTDYKAGWQIERDWEKFKKREKEKLAGNYNGEEEEEENWEIHSDDDDDDEDGNNVDEDGLPFACYICRDGFSDPVVTKCGHYFCSECAINKYSKSDGCAVCGAKTEGSFQTATKLIKKLKKRKK